MVEKKLTTQYLFVPHSSTSDLLYIELATMEEQLLTSQ